MNPKRLPILIIIIAILLYIAYNYLQVKNTETKNPNKNTFIGNWVGDKYENNSYVTWIQKRLSDGTYTIFFVTIKGDTIIRDIETGKWWIKDGKYYEISPNANTEPSIYDYKIITNDSIMFSSTSSDYKFVDKRIEENNFDSTLIIEPSKTINNTTKEIKIKYDKFE